MGEAQFPGGTVTRTHQGRPDSLPLERRRYGQRRQSQSRMTADINARKHNKSRNLLPDPGDERQLRDICITFPQRHDKVLLAAVTVLGSGKSSLYHLINRVIILWHFLFDC